MVALVVAPETSVVDRGGLVAKLHHRHYQAEVLRDLGDALLKVGRGQQARESWQEALVICEALRIPETVEVRQRLARPPGPRRMAR